MSDITSTPGDAGHGSFGFQDDSSEFSQGRGRVRSADFGLPARSGLLDLARTYLETQARLWPGLAGTTAVPAADEATITAMAEDFERRFRDQAAEAFKPQTVMRPWDAIGVAYLRFSDENSNPRSLDQQLLNVLNRARRDGVFVPWQFVLADAAVSGTVAYRRGYTIAKALVEHRDEFGVSWFLIDDLSRMSRNTIESLQLGELAAATGVRIVGASDGFDSANPQSSILLPMLGSMNEAFVTQLKAKVKRGMDDAFRRGENIQPPGVGYRMVAVTNPDGTPVINQKGQVEKRAEIDPEAAGWIVRGAEMIAHEGKSPVEVARLFNEQQVGDRQTWSDNGVRKLYARERLIGREVFRTSRQEKNRQTGKIRTVKLPQAEWLVRESPHLRILSDELATAVRAKLNLAAQSFGRTAKDKKMKTYRDDLYPRVLVRPVCSGCGTPMILGRSDGKNQSFCCFNAISGIKGCTNRGYKSAHIIDEAVLTVVKATIFTEGFVTDLTAEVNARLAEIARRPIPSTKKLEQEIARDDRQLKRLADRLAKADVTHLDAVIGKAEEMGRQLSAKRERLKELQRAGRRPGVKRVREQDVVAALTNLRDVLQGNVGGAAQVLKALVGDVVVEARRVEGRRKPEMVAKFTIDGIPALAALDRGKALGVGNPTVGVWEFLNADRWIMLGKVSHGRREVVVPLRRPRKYERLLPQVVQMAEAGSSVDLITRALGVSKAVVRDALHLHQSGIHPPARVDSRYRKGTKRNSPFVPKYKQLAAEVDRRRRAGESFDRLARELKVSHNMIVRAYDYANHDEAAAAAREGRKPTRPPYKRTEDPQITKRKPRKA